MSLTAYERELFSWQLDLPGFGEREQIVLRRSTALISRIGGVGGPLAFSLAAAGIGRLILAHAGDLQTADLNRQILMAGAEIGQLRVNMGADTLRRFAPHVEVVAIPQNPSANNAAALVAEADIVFSCAPLFEERLALNGAAVRKGRWFVDCAMHSGEGHVLPVKPAETACLECLVPSAPDWWRRRFPVLGAVSALVAQIGALEGVKLLTGWGESQAGKLIHVDAAAMRMKSLTVVRRSGCKCCGVSKLPPLSASPIENNE